MSLVAPSQPGSDTIRLQRHRFHGEAADVVVTASTEVGMAGLLGVLAAAVVCQVPPATPVPPDPGQAVVVIDCFDRERQIIHSVSGFAITTDRVVTAAHCILGASRLEINAGRDGSSEAKVIASNIGWDIVVLQSQLPPSVRPLTLRRDRGKPGERLRTIVRDADGKARVEPATLKANGTSSIYGEYVDLSCDARPGLSGCAVVDDLGNAIGMGMGGDTGILSAESTAAIRSVVEAAGKAETAEEWHRTQGLECFFTCWHQLVQARDASLAGDHAKAVELLTAVVSACPKYQRAHQLRLTNLMDERRFDEFDAGLNLWLASGGPPDLIEVCRASVWSRRERPEEALKAAQRAVAANVCYETMVCLGTAQWLSGEIAHAKESLRRAAEMDPQQADPWTRLGRLATEDGHFDEAVTAYRKVAELEWSEQGPIYLSYALSKLNRPEEALAAAQEAIRRSPQSAEAYATVGWVELRANHEVQARNAYEHAVELNPKYVGATVALANIYLRASRELEAALLLEKLPEEPPNSGVLTTLVRCYRKLDDKKGEDRALERLRTVDPLEYNRLKR
jgi:Tfp pilus assembly protein PilF